jgi:hypothetical protein
MWLMRRYYQIFPFNILYYLSILHPKSTRNEMNRLFSKIALILALLTLNLTVFAQKPEVGCVDVNVQGQADAVKLGFSKKGMAVFQEAMFSMHSMEPTPVAVKLYKGITYQLIFVGSESASKIIMEIYDGSDKKIDEEVERGSSNNIIYAFTPEKTDVYLITLIQKKGVKEMCGYFGVMMKGKLPATAVKAQPVAKPVNQPMAAPAKTAPVKTTTAPPVNAQPVERSTRSKELPANQRPNPNRTRATNEALKEQKR